MSPVNTRPQSNPGRTRAVAPRVWQPPQRVSLTRVAADLAQLGEILEAGDRPAEARAARRIGEDLAAAIR